MNKYAPASVIGAVLLAVLAWVWAEAWGVIKDNERDITELWKESSKRQDRLDAAIRDIQTLRVLHTDTPHGPARSVENPTDARDAPK